MSIHIDTFSSLVIYKFSTLLTCDTNKRTQHGTIGTVILMQVVRCILNVKDSVIFWISVPKNKDTQIEI